MSSPITTPPGRTHRCPGGCARQVPSHHFACRTDWFRLPINLREPISDNYLRDPAAHLAAMQDAMQWYREHPRDRRTT